MPVAATSLGICILPSSATAPWRLPYTERHKWAQALLDVIAVGSLSPSLCYHFFVMLFPVIFVDFIAIGNWF